MGSNEKIVQSTLRTVTAQSIFQSDKQTFDALKQAANIYLKRVGILSDFYKNTIAKKKVSEKIRDIYSHMRENEKFTQQMLRYQHQFEQALNTFLQRKIYLTYVKDDGTLNFYDDINIGKLYEQAGANRGRGNISSSKIFDANDLEENIKNILNESVKNKKMVYLSALQRYHKTQKEESFVYNPSKNTFYWRLNDSYHITGWTHPFSNTGPIAQGYAGAIINDEKNEISNDSIEKSLYLLYTNYIEKDSIGAAIKGDIIYNKDNSIQFAVKKGSFSTAMVGQYMNLALNIQRLKQITKEDFEKILPRLIKMTKLTNQIIDIANGEATQQIREKVLSKLGITFSS